MRTLALALVVITLSGGRPFPAENFINSVRVSGRWSVEGRDFVFEGTQSTLLNDSNPMVMVSFNPLSPFGLSLKNDPRVLAYFSSPNSGIGRAILIMTSESEREQLAKAVHDDIHACGGIEQITPSLRLMALGDAASPMSPTSVPSPSVQALVEQINSSLMQSTVASLEAMGTRYHASSQPNQVSDAVYSQWQSLAPAGASVTQVSHGTTSQKSVVITIPGSQVSSNNGATVVLGAHMDSINSSNQSQAPGADDDATGIAALTEILRVIKAQGTTFTRTIELHAYAAEEVGLLGSADLATTALNTGKNVVAMLQLDMIGYAPITGDTTIHLITTDTSPVLTRHLKDLVAQYLGNTWSSGSLNAGTSDHRSWYRRGFHAAFAFEHPTNYNHALHTSADTASKLDFNLAARFTKLALAFLAHEAGATTALADSEALWATQLQTSGRIKLSAARSSAGGYRLGAAVDAETEATTAELCQIQSGVAKGCKSLVTETTGPVTKHSKKFFVTTADTDLTDGDLWRVHTYNTSGSLTATRSFKLRKK